jgi:hypothetical protein
LAREEQLADLDTPIFVCTLSYPSMPTFLHVFEPRYRLMLRRATGANKRFGMAVPSDAHGGVYEYGTLLEIKQLDVLPDGRSMVETVGVARFKILRTGTLDGYMVSETEAIEDVSPTEEQRLDRVALERSTAAEQDRLARRARGEDAGPPIEPELTTEQLISRCHEFLDLLRSGAAPWLRQKLSDTLGPVPSTPADFSWYMAAVMPVYEQEKIKLLAVRAAALRLAQAD